MALRQKSAVMTEAEYLTFERASKSKHEFIAGEVFAMVGASEAHNLISVNVITALNNQLRTRPCKIYPSDMRVKVADTRLYTYPDIIVVYGNAEFADSHFDTLVNPTVIFEILSPSTERYDRGKKFQDYRELPSLREYVLISQDSPRIERFLLQAQGTWELLDAKGLDATLDLTSIACTLALAEVYAKVTFTPDEEVSS
jgi:Uma2 family endonuclease